MRNVLRELLLLQGLHRYSQAWCDAACHEPLTGAVADLIEPNVEMHHTTPHAKPPETGHPFPMHHDWVFYKHVGARFVDCLVHLDDTNDDNDAQLRDLLLERRAVQQSRTSNVSRLRNLINGNQ